jgi:hypothetical protein
VSQATWKLKGALDLDLVPLHFILEGYLPGCHAMGLMVEDKAIHSFQMIQAPIMKISMNNGWAKANFAR